jgi:hypothetical protein
MIDPKVYSMESFFASSSSNSNESKIKLMKCLFELPKKGFGAIIATTYCAISRTFITASSGKTIAIYKYDPY